MTADGATNNDTTAEGLSRRFSDVQIEWNAKENRLYCAPHAIHRAVEDLLSTLDPRSPHSSSAQSDISLVSPVIYQVSVTDVEIDDDDAELLDSRAVEIPVGIEGAISRVSLIFINFL
jgi:hypothetical protein